MEKMKREERQIVDLWSVKYAMTAGIQFRESYETTDGRYAYGKPNEKYWGSEQLVIGLNAFYTEAEAKAKAVKIAERKLKSMEKAKAKVLKLIEGWK